MRSPWSSQNDSEHGGLIPRNFHSFWPSDTICWHRSGSTWAQVMACRLIAPSYYLNQCGLLISEVSWHSPVSSFTANTQGKLFCIMIFKIILLKFLPHQWEAYSLWPDDAIWRQRSGSTLAQVMACCLTAPSHYLNQCWSIIREVQSHSY